MTTIKEIAAALGVSPSTVSIVLAGNGTARKISAQTQRRVLEEARTRGYRPSIAARSLRSGAADGQELLTVAVFWAEDFRAGMMVRFLRGLRKGIETGSRRVRLLLYTYTNGQLCSEAALQTRSACHAAIVCNASAADQCFLESARLPLPIVLYNRYSHQYGTVNVNDYRMGQLAALALADNGCKRAAVLTSAPVYPGMERRTLGFAETCRQRGIALLGLGECDNSLSGGYHALISREPDSLPDGIFCGSDNIALGALRALWERRIRVPEQMRIVSIGNGDRENEEYAIPSLSVVALPMEQMASECLSLLLETVADPQKACESRELAVSYIERESCGGIRTDVPFQEVPPCCDPLP